MILAACLQVVYKGLRNDVTPVAIKVMSRGGASLVGLTPEQKARQLEEFKREILILKACRDKNIVTFLGASLQVNLAAWMLLFSYLRLHKKLLKNPSCSEVQLPLCGRTVPQCW